MSDVGKHAACLVAALLCVAATACSPKNSVRTVRRRSAVQASAEMCSPDGAPDEDRASSATSEGKLVGGDVQEQIWNYLTTSGFSDAAAAGVMGNIQQESNFKLDYENYHTGVGMLQMTDDRARRMVAIASEQGIDWKTNPKPQLDYVIENLPSQLSAYSGHGTYTYSNGTQTWWPEAVSFEQYKSTDDVDWAAEVFCRTFERPSLPMMENRKSYAQQWYAKYTGHSAGSDTTVGDEANSQCGCNTGTGDSTGGYSIAKLAVEVCPAEPPEVLHSGGPGSQWNKIDDPRLDKYFKIADAVDHPVTDKSGHGHNNHALASCTQAASHIIRATVDPDCWNNSMEDLEGYMKQSPKWELVTENPTDMETQCQPGDIMCSNTHTAIYVGNDLVRAKYPGSDTNVWEAGYTSRSYPHLSRYDGASGFRIYRFTGKTGDTQNQYIDAAKVLAGDSDYKVDNPVGFSGSSSACVGSSGGGWRKIGGHWEATGLGDGAVENDFDKEGADTGDYDVMHDSWSKHRDAESKTGYLVIIDQPHLYVSVFKGKKGKWKPVRGFNCTDGGHPQTFEGETTLDGTEGRHDEEGYWLTYVTNAAAGFHARPADQMGKPGISHNLCPVAPDNAKWIHDNVPIGTKVISSETGEYV